VNGRLREGGAMKKRIEALDIENCDVKSKRNLKKSMFSFSCWINDLVMMRNNITLSLLLTKEGKLW